MAAVDSAFSALTKEQCLTQHPWPKEFAQQPRLEWFWQFEVPLSSAELWRLLADSSRLNHALGVSEMKFKDRGSERWGTSQPAGVHHEWLEVPWNWVAERWLESVRIYKSGFSRVVYSVFVIQPIDAEHSQMSLYFGAIPRGVLSGLLLRLGFSTLYRDYSRLLPQLAEEVRNRRPPSLSQPASPLAEGAESRLGTIRDSLLARKLDPVCIDRLIDWIRKGEDSELYRIQVRQRALLWKVDEDALLRVCLHATRLGMLELSWDVMCPHCRGVSRRNDSLGDVPVGSRCEVCQIDVGTDAAESIEITFHVHPSIREVPLRTFCSGEPSTKEHIRVQYVVAAQSAVTIAPPLSPGRYRLRLHGEKRYGYLDVETENKRSEAVWRSSSEPGNFAVAAEFSITLQNDSTDAQRFVIEVAQWSDLALRPGRLLSLQEFRDLFSEEYLGTDVQLAIGEQTILFTDMVGSTALYAKQGDAVAFREVRRHFSDVFAIIAQRRGAVVKTIGDAVMGAFTNPLDAVMAAKEIHDCFPPGRTDSAARLRISLNTGPCIAVKLNTDLDYFGHTVNVAAKLQSLADAWQIAMSERVYAAPSVKEWLDSRAVQLEDLRYESSALRAAVPVKRWTVYR